MRATKRFVFILFGFIVLASFIPASVLSAEQQGGMEMFQPAQEDAIAVANALLDDPKIRSLMSAMFETKLMIMTGRLVEPEEDRITWPQGGPSLPRALTEAEAPGPQVSLSVDDFGSLAQVSLPGDVLVNNPASDKGLSTTQSETTIAVNPITGTICSAYNDSQHWAFGAIGFSGFSRSTDGGVTFTDQGPFPVGGGGNNFGDPSLVWSEADGYFYYAALHTNGLGLWRSTDECESFAYLSMIHTGAGDDREMMAVDNNPSSPYYGRLYVAWTDFNAGARIYVTSSDDGTTWTTPVALSGVGVDAYGAWPAVSPNGDVYVAWVRWNPYPSGPIDIEIVRSTDGGASFNPVTNPMTGQVNPRDAAATANCGRPALKANASGGIRHAPSPQIAVGPDGCLHVVYPYDPDGYGAGDVVDVFYRRSCNGGTSWDAEVGLSDDATTTDQWFPTVSVGPSNVVVATWYDRRNDAANNYLFDYYKAISHDGGVTWGPNIRVSDVSSQIPTLSPNFDPIVATCYHGDYDQQVQDHQYVYIQWSDDRNFKNAHPDPDIWFEKELTWHPKCCGTTVLQEDFESWPPAGWTIVDNGGSCVWESNAITGRSNYTGGSGNCADADADWCGLSTTMDTELQTPTLDLTGFTCAMLEFKSHYYDIGGGDHAYVDISTDGGVTWTNLLTWNEDHFGPFTERLDLGPYVGSANVMFRFGYVAPAWDWYWEIDDVVVSGGRCMLEAPIPQPSMDSVVLEYNDESYVVAGYGSNRKAYKYDPSTDLWTRLADQPDPTIEYPVDGCLGYNDSGDPQIFVFPDTASLQTNIMVYDISSDSWSTLPLLGGFTARWAADIAYDPTKNLCYISGGATAPGPGNLNELWAYDPENNTFTQLASFTSARDFHASWNYRGKVYIAGGYSSAVGPLDSTQVYTIATNTWNPENADLGPLPAAWWGMGDTHEGPWLWLMGGVYNGGISKKTGYFDLTSGIWVEAGDLCKAVFRVEGDLQVGDPYLVGGSIGGFSYQPFNQHILSPTVRDIMPMPFPWLLFYPAFIKK